MVRSVRNIIAKSAKERDSAATREHLHTIASRSAADPTPRGTSSPHCSRSQRRRTFSTHVATVILHVRLEVDGVMPDVRCTLTPEALRARREGTPV